MLFVCFYLFFVPYYLDYLHILDGFNYSIHPGMSGEVSQFWTLKDELLSPSHNIAGPVSSWWFLICCWKPQLLQMEQNQPRTGLF